MTSHADILIALLDELERCDRRVAALTRANEAQVLASRARIDSGLAQMVRQRDEPDPPRRQHGIVLAPPVPARIF